MADDKPTLSGKIIAVKEALALVREFSLVLAILVTLVLFFAFPSTLELIFSKAGIVEANIANVFKWKSKTSDAIQKLESANQIIEVLRKNLVQSNKELLTIQRNTLTPRSKTSLEKLIAKNKGLIGSSSVSQRAIEKVIRANSSVVKEVAKLVGAKSERWGIVFGADTTVEGASHESNLAIAMGLARVKLYKRSGWFRNVVEFNSRNEASRNIDRLKSINTKPYIVNLETWCPKSRIRENRDFVECL